MCIRDSLHGIHHVVDIVLALAFLVVPPETVVISFAGALVVNLVIAVNHRRDRYIAV